MTDETADDFFCKQCGLSHDDNCGCFCNECNELMEECKCIEVKYSECCHVEYDEDIARCTDCKESCSYYEVKEYR